MSEMKSFKENEVFIDELIRELDVDGDGEITEEEFFEVCKDHSEWVDGFNDCIFGTYLKMKSSSHNNVIPPRKRTNSKRVNNYSRRRMSIISYRSYRSRTSTMLSNDNI